MSELVCRKRNARAQRRYETTLDDTVLRVIRSSADHAEICKSDGSAREVVTREHMRYVAENSVFWCGVPLRSKFCKSTVNGRCQIRIINVSANHECSKFEDDVDISVVDDIDIVDDQLDIVDGACNIRTILDIELVVCFAGYFHIRRSCSCNAAFISSSSCSNRLRQR